MNLLLVDFLWAEYRTLVENKMIIAQKFMKVNFNFANEMKKNNLFLWQRTKNSYLVIACLSHGMGSQKAMELTVD